MNLSGTEQEIMDVLWKHDEGLTFAELLEYFNTVKKKNWCRQTLNTCLLRLKQKKLVRKEKSAAKAVYFSAVTQARYRQMCAEDILKESYGGVLSNFIAALAGKNQITEMEKEELLKYIENER